ncbi:MAG: nuclear transport factor 2 family protein [Saprospiraceae bacterium]|nr:nuclear transport factor 2 family protein [Saprospiraceae bacterium]
MTAKQFSIRFFFAAFLCAAFAPSLLHAQDVDKELAAFAQQFQDAYNKEDAAALQAFYTDDAVRVAKDGSSISGAANIGAFWAAQFQGADATLTLTQSLVSWSDANHAYIAKGTYQVTGTTAKGDAFSLSGGYSNIMLQQNGAWKISHSALIE